MRVLKWVPWAALDALVLFFWMVLGVAALAVVNYVGLGLGPKRMWKTPVRVAYAELPALTFLWPLALLLATSRARTLSRALPGWLAAMGLVSLVAGGWNVAGHPFGRPAQPLDGRGSAGDNGAS